MNWRGGQGDVLKEFVAAAKRWNIAVCYYINPLDDGYLTQIANVSAREFETRQKGMLTELLAPGSQYGPVHRLWFDGSGSQRPKALLTNYEVRLSVDRHFPQTTFLCRLDDKWGEIVRRTTTHASS